MPLTCPQLIDPYWTLAPPLILHFYRTSLLRSTWGSARQLAATGLLWAWSIRLTYSYFRRCFLAYNEAAIAMTTCTCCDRSILGLCA
jgi:steroid 5-alpha reductase family enzyme